MTGNEIWKRAASLTSTNLLYMRKRKESSLLLCRALGYRPGSKTHIILFPSIRTQTHSSWITSLMPHHTPWSMRNFSASLRMCLVSILGAMRPMLCLDRERRGNRLWKHTQSCLDSYICKLMPTCTTQALIHSCVFHTCLSLLHWSWGGTRSPAVWQVAVPDDCGPWRRTLPVAAYPAGLTVCTSAEEHLK